MVSLNMKKRIFLIFFCSALLVGLLVVRVAWIQFVQGPQLQAKAIDSRLRNIDVKAKRGIIYDRNGSPLAISVSTDSVYAVPAQVKTSKKLNEIAHALAEVLEMEEEIVQQKLNKKIAFEWIKRRVPDEKIKQLKELDLPGINFVEENQRYYPHGNLAAHILGFAGIDNQGLNGLEISYEKELKGIAGKIMIEYDAAGREIPNAMHQYIPPEDGYSLYLTIDETIQYIAERELEKVFKLKNPEKASIIVLDVKTGDILALANRPDYDPNNYADYDQDTWRNVAISDAYEPGSTFKVITTSAALEEGLVNINSRFYCSGFVQVGKHQVKCWRSYNPHGSQSFLEGVQNSCNPVFIELGFRLGKENFYKYLKGFGFGSKTGIELPGEATGILVAQSLVKDIDLASMSMGQANAVTPLQLIRAIAAGANDGWLMKPRLVKEIRDVEGNLIRVINPEPLRQVVSSTTSSELRNILEQVVSDGTGSNAQVEGYKIAGKTGTAQKILPGGGYSKSQYVASFAGFAPADDPQIAVLVVIDAPEGSYFGGQVAAPVFQSVVLDVLRYLKIPPSIEKNNDKLEESIIIPDLKGQTIEGAIKSLKTIGLEGRIDGEGEKVITHLPPAGTKVMKRTEVILYTRDLATETINVPDLKGATIREAGIILEELGLQLLPQGSGLAILQDPQPGIKVDKGANVKVMFSSNQDALEETMGP